MPRSPADDLARLRAQIAVLRAREAALEARFLEMNETGRFPGFTCDVVVSRTGHEILDVSKLPAGIVDDPRYRTTRHVTSVRIEARDPARPPAWALPDPGDDFDLIERD
ncbi:hypothetical protein [Celeribacter indicus]|nr:hypothetical protein [Celeribacter indicus]